MRTPPPSRGPPLRHQRQRSTSMGSSSSGQSLSLFRPQTVTFSPLHRPALGRQHLQSTTTDSMSGWNTLSSSKPRTGKLFSPFHAPVLWYRHPTCTVLLSTNLHAQAPTQAGPTNGQQRVDEELSQKRIRRKTAFFDRWSRQTRRFAGV